MSHTYGQDSHSILGMFQNDPKLLDDLNNHRVSLSNRLDPNETLHNTASYLDPECLERSHDSYKLVKRLEAVKKLWSSRKTATGCDNGKALLDELIPLYIQTSDSIKISRAVEKLWQSCMPTHSDYLGTVLEGYILKMLKPGAIDSQDVTKVSVLFEQNKAAQYIVRQNLSKITDWIASHLCPLIELPPFELSHGQAHCLYCFIKISLQLFQICPSGLAPSVWKLEPAAWDRECSERPARDKASAKPRSESVKVIVESLVHVLCVKGYHIDCVLLSGTALGLLLNTAPDYQVAVKSFDWLLYLTLKEGSDFDYLSLANCQYRMQDITIADQLDMLSHITRERMGPVALIRGTVVCASAEFLCHMSDDNENLQSNGQLYNESSEGAKKGVGMETNCDHTLYKLFQYTLRLCQGDITLHYHAFQTLTLWYSRLSKLSSSQQSSFTDTYAPSLLKSTLELVMLNWDSPVEDVPEAVVDIFSNMMSLWTRVKDRMPEFCKTILDVLVKTEWLVKGKYRIMAALLKYLEPDQMAHVCTGIQPQLLQCLATNHLASSASAVYKAFLTQMKGDKSSDVVEEWQSVWLQTLITGLVSSNVLLRHNTSLHWVPATLKIIPGSADCLQTHLCTLLESQNSVTCHSRLLHAWTVVANTVRSLLGKTDLTNSHIREALYSSDEDIRSEAIALICTTLKKAECLSKIEASLLKEVIPYNIKVDSATFRQHLGSSLRRLLVRLRDSCITMLKAPVDNKPNLDCAIDFVDWLHSLCMLYLLPGACYQRRKGSLDLLHVIYESFIYCPDSKQRKGYSPETSVKLVDFAVSKGRWSFFSDRNTETLIICLLDGADEIQTSTFHLLTRYYTWPLEDNVGAPDSRCCHLLSSALQLCCSPKGHESQSGAVLCKLIFQKFVLVNGIGFDFHRGVGESVYKVSASVNHVSPAPKFLRCLLNEVNQSLKEAERNLVIASKNYPIHGLVAALCQCLSESEDLWTISREEIETVLIDLIVLCQTTIDKMLAIMASVAGQETCPSFAEIGMALENLLLENQPEYAEGTAQSPEYQYMLSWCWNNIKESCISLGELMWTVVTYEIALPLATVNSMGATFLSVLTKCRHKGVIEGCRSSFIRFCSALFKSQDDKLPKIPGETLSQVLTNLKNKAMKSSVTRRSAGLPIIIQAVLTSEKKIKQHALLTMAISELFQICELPLDDDHGVKDLPQVHGLNILNSLFSDASLTASLMGNVSRAMVLVIHQFGSPSWAIRNAATRFFSTLVTRIFGQKKTAGDDDTTFCNSVTFQEFSSYYPELSPLFLDILTEACRQDVQDISKIHPSLFPVLTVLSLLKPVEKEDKGLNRTLRLFADHIKQFVFSPVYQLRHLVAPAFAAMVNMTNLMDTTILIIQQYLPQNDDQKNTTLNSIHGILLLINRILDYITKSDDLQILWTELVARWWLVDVNHGMVAAQYIRLLNRLSQRHESLQAKPQMFDAVLKLCCHGAAKVGDGVFNTEAVQFMFRAVRNLQGENFHTLIVKILESSSAETRKACLLKLEAELEKMHCSRQNIQSILCCSLKNEDYQPNICVTLNMISKLYLETRAILPVDLDHIKDWFQKCFLTHSKCRSLFAASVPVQGIVIQHMIKNGLRGNEAAVFKWCEAVRSSSEAMNETLRLSAALALQVVGDCVFLEATTEGSQMEACTVSLMSACITLLQDEDTEICAEACKVVSNLQWTERQVQYECVHSNICFEMFLQYIAVSFWRLPGCVQFLCDQLYCIGNLSTVLKDKAKARFQQLFDQEDNSFFAERLYNAIEYHKTLKDMVKKSEAGGEKTVTEILKEYTKITTDIDAVLESLQAVSRGSLINIFTDNAVLSSVTSLILMSDLVAMVTDGPAEQLIRSKLDSIFQEKKLPAAVQRILECACHAVLQHN